MVQENMSFLEKINRLLLKRKEAEAPQMYGINRSPIVNNTPEWNESDGTDDLVGYRAAVHVWSRTVVPDGRNTLDGEALIETIAERIMKKFHRVSYAFAVETLRRYCWTYETEDFDAAMELLVKRGKLRVEGGRARVLTAREKIRVA